MAQAPHQTQVIGGPDIVANVAAIRERIARAAVSAGRRPEDVTLVAVSKTFPAKMVTAAHAAGIRHFGENWVQEAQTKIPQFRDSEPRTVWHMVGHLQTNKVKVALELFDVIQSIDSLHLGEAIARRAGSRRVPVLLEVNVAGEASKSGFTPEDVPDAVRVLQHLTELEVLGLMTVAPEVPDPEQVRPVFRRLRELRDALGLADLSMGMSEDYEVATEEGATIIRLGRAIFGHRPQI